MYGKVNYNTINNTASNSIDTTITRPDEEISSYKTKIYTKTDERQTNLRLACDELNNCIIHPGETFSFCDTLGQATPAKGYKKAGTFDSDGDEIQAYGGGKCQISSTLYNAVKNIDGIEIVERHEHSAKVYYVPDGQDAAVSYGSVDFKFKNNSSNSLKILAETTGEEVIIRIMKIT